MNIGPVQLGLVDALVITNSLSTLVLGWLAWRSERRVSAAEANAQHWEGVARGVAVRAKQDRAEMSKETIIAPAWHAPFPDRQTPGQRLAHLVSTNADWRVEAD